MSLSSLAIHSTRNGVLSTVGLFSFLTICSLPPNIQSLIGVLCLLALVSELLLPFETEKKRLTVEADALEMIPSVGSSWTWKSVSSCSPILAIIMGGVDDSGASLPLSFWDTGVTEQLLPLSGTWLKSLALFGALLALEVQRFLGEANHFPRFSCGTFMASPSGKCLPTDAMEIFQAFFNEVQGL